MEALNLNEIINLLSVLALAAAVAGFMAGLLGVGGGIIMVPALYYAFTVLDFDIVTRMHLSVGTSLAIIIPTSIISTLTHREHDAVDFNMVKSFGIFIYLRNLYLISNFKKEILKRNKVLDFQDPIYSLKAIKTKKEINTIIKFAPIKYLPIREMNFKSDLRKDKRIVAKDKLAAILNKIVPISLIIYILWFYAHHVSNLRWHVIFIMFSENLIGNKITFTI